MKLNYLFVAGIALCAQGCIAAAAGAGAEAGYVLTQGERTAGETVDDQRITASVKASLLADQDVSGLDINVDTFKKSVTLKGVVDSLQEAEKAVSLARNISGVKDVTSKLVVMN